MSQTDRLLTQGEEFYLNVNSTIKEKSKTILPPSETFFWGYLCSIHPMGTIDYIYDRVALVYQLEKDGIINEADKVNLYKALAKNIQFDVNEYIIMKLDNPNKKIDFSKMDSKEERKLNEDMIKKIQEEDKLMQDALKKKSEERSKAPCKICLDELTTKSITILNDCGHCFHVECLGKYSKIKVDSRELPIRCPEPDCKMELRVDDLEEIFDKNTLEKFREFALKNYLDHSSEDVSWCPTANCPFVFINEDGITDFLCPVCKKRYCFACRVPYHSGQTCKEYQINNKYDKNDDKFLNLMKSKKFKQCPKCKYWIEKNQGCNSMVCRCGHSFCYGCGKSPCSCKSNLRRIPMHPIDLDPEYWDVARPMARPRPKVQKYKRPDLLEPDDDYYADYESYRREYIE